MKFKYLAVMIVTGILVIFFTGCGVNQAGSPANQQTRGPVEADGTQRLPAPQVLRRTQTPPPFPTDTKTPTPVPPPTSTNTPDPIAPWTIENLQSRTYGGGELEVVSTLADNSYFTRYLIEYPSDDLAIAGFMNVPKGDGPFPVVIAIHGYIEPGIYSTLDYTTRYADDLARNGFLVIHPNLRNYPPSSLGENLFRVGMAIDILNLIEIIKQNASIQSYLDQADGQSIGLWGHSMGGGISTRVMTINHDVKAVFLYAAMSGDEGKNFDAINRWSNGARGLDELEFSEIELQRISPQNYFNQITAAVSIHHGLSDELVPVEWSQTTCDLLIQLNKPVNCVYYSDMPHTFFGENDRLLMDAAAIFFKQHLIETPQP